jgi:predicted carbohydrate-binding protein with CBM5 and CBM33 domain
VKKHVLLIIGIAVGLLSVAVLVPFGQVAQAQGKLVAPMIFQAAGPTAESIEGTVEAYRTALGEPNNANNPGPLATSADLTDSTPLIN